MLKLVRIGLVFLILLISPATLADGGAFKRLVEDPTAANMPDQAALIAFKDNTETLAIETHFEGSPSEFAWVVPLPSVPTVAAASPGLFKTLPALFPRKIETHVTFLWVPALLICGLCLLSFVKSRFLSFSLGIALISVSIILILPSLGKARGASVPVDAVEIKNHEIVGNFELTTISSKDPGELTKWLIAQGYKVSPASANAITDYVKDGWCFVAAKARRPLSTNPSEIITPHPLVFTFKTPQAIYPMRLTGAGNTGPLAVDLFIFGSGTAHADGWTTRMSAPTEIISQENVDHYGGSPRYITGVTVSHPAIRNLVSDLPHATRLSARLSPSQMNHDVAITFGPPQEHRESVWDTGSAIGRGFAHTIIVFAVLLLITVFGFSTRPESFRISLVSASLLIASAGGVITFFATPLAGPTMSRGGYNVYHMFRNIEDDVEKFKKSKTPINEAVIESIFRRRFMGSGFTNTDLKREDSPGNFMIEKIGDTYHLKFYDWSGQENVIIF